MDSTITKERNLGIDFLKAWMAFEVVLCHYGHGSDEFVFRYFFSYFRTVTVPVFMMISFYFSKKMILDKENDNNSILRRMKRIYLPLVFWAIAYYVICNAIYLLTGDVNFNSSLESLVWQLLLGHGNNPAMWYNVNLALLTLLFFYIHKVCPRKAVYIYIFMAAVSIICQYSELNTCFLPLGLTISHPLGRIFETIPYALLGLLISSYFKVNNWILLLVYAVCLILCLFLGFKYTHYSYGHAGVGLMLLSFTIMLIFMNIPFNRLSPFVKSPILFVAKYSMGIYCIHLLVGRIVIACGVDIKPFYLTILIYFISLIACYLISLIPLRLFKSAVE